VSVPVDPESSPDSPCSRSRSVCVTFGSAVHASAFDWLPGASVVGGQLASLEKLYHFLEIALPTALHPKKTSPTSFALRIADLSGPSPSPRCHSALEEFRASVDQLHEVGTSMHLPVST